MDDERPTLPTDGEVPLIDLSQSVGITTDSVRQWLRRNHPDQLRRVARREGGAVLWVGAAGVAAVRARWSDKTQPDATDGAETPERLADALTRPVASEPLALPSGRDETATPWPAEAVAALLASEHRATDAEARLDERGRELTEVRAEIKDAHGRLDALYRRVGELERATGQLGERVRAWRDWYARVSASSWWARRRLPDAPEDVKPGLVQ